MKIQHKLIVILNIAKNVLQKRKNNSLIIYNISRKTFKKIFLINKNEKIYI